MTGSADTFPYTFGIEEEFFLSHPKSRSLALAIPRSLFRAGRRRFGAAVASEMLQAQVELISPVLATHAQAEETLTDLRRGIAEIAIEKDLRLLAAGTHPIAPWSGQAETPKARYREILEEFQIVGRRNVVCGLHIHVAVPSDLDRVVVMNRVMHWLPLFLALSTSSPFWGRRVTGLLSYRQAAYDEWPRTGVPDRFADEAEYARFVELLVAGGAIKDASYLWWAIRPALRYPTLELRICDACTRVEDSLAIAGLYRCLVRMLVRRPDAAPSWTPFTRRLIDENRWRAKRFGLDAELLSEDGSPPRACRTVIESLLGDLDEDASALGCERALARIRTLLTEGTSAHRQLAIYEARVAQGDTTSKARQSVVDWLVAATYPAANETTSPGASSA